MRRQKREILNATLIAANQAKTGYVLAEAAPALWILLIGILFPLLILATLTFRLGLFWMAAGQAAQYACGAQVFSPTSSSTQPSGVVPAVTLASTTANSVLNMFPGSVTLIQPVNVYIGTTQISSSVISWSSTPNVPLSSVDTDENIYSIRVVLVGQVEPLIRITLPFFGTIPGLTSPFVATVAEERVFENPSGLTQLQ